MIDEQLFVPGTRKPEEDYEELEKLGAALAVPIPATRISLVVADKYGNIVDEYKDRSRTYNRNFWTMIFCTVSGSLYVGSTFGAGYLAVKEKSGNVYTTTNYYGESAGLQLNFPQLYPLNSGTYGGNIVLGTSSAAENFEGYSLGAIIPNGTSSGQISFGSAQVGTPSYNSGTKTWTNTFFRVGNNNSGSTITIAEMAFGLNSAYNGSECMVCRDVLSPTVAVPNAGQVTATYTFSLTFPA